MSRNWSTAAAHPAGDLPAASDELPRWLRLWVKDQAEGATVNEVLGLLIETARDPALLTVAYLAERSVVHPGEFIQDNRDRFELREDEGCWILGHRNDGRPALRVRRGEGGSWELVEPLLGAAQPT